MPASNKLAYTAESRNPESEEPQAVAEQGSFPSRAGKRKTKNGAARQLSSLDHADKGEDSAAMGQTQPPTSSSLNPSSSILGQLPQTYSHNRKFNSFDALDETSASQKVSDEHTPPVDLWARNAARGKTPPVEPIPGLNTGTSPEYEPGFSTRGAFSTRSPPISPPMRNARPVSYGGGVPTLPNHHRQATSPYGYGMPAYGSPPALPHLPQQHFYGAHDIDLGIRHAHTPLPEPVPLKFTHLPGSGSESRAAALLAGDGELHVVGYNGEKVEYIGAIGGSPGTIIDAALLTWNAGEDPFASLRPLVALVLHGSEAAESNPLPHEDQTFRGGPGNVAETKVVVFSLSKSRQVAELLRVPPVMGGYLGPAASNARAASLKVHASGNFVVVASSDSGELFVFTPRQSKEAAVFECLAKYWTIVQPRLQRRASFHGPTSDSDVSPADLGRGPESDDPPILSLAGRWLAFCPASTSPRRSIGAVLGDSVIHNKNSTINSGTAPARPLANCEVDSSDVDTFFSKVAKGFAQEAVRGAKWIGEKGMQTWQSYWKKDTGSPNLPPLPSSSPPVYSPYLGLGQFPPTHAIEQQDSARDPELVTIVDLRLLQDTQGRKLLDSSPLITFQPPGGCSFLSFTPTGLSILTASFKGDVQYIWDLMQMRYVKTPTTSTSTESGRVRQIARYERLSPCVIVDVSWDGPNGYRFALLTKNRTVHIFDLPTAAFQWPPPPTIKKSRPTSAPVDPAQVKLEHDPAPPGGFLASAMSIAGRTQPMLASLRGRAPSISSGSTGPGPSGIGFASTTSIKSSGRAVAAGLSKSLGAASETVTSIRHANQSRLHLKIPARNGMLYWLRRDGKSLLSVLDENSVKNYYVRITMPRENRQLETVSVFDARKAVTAKLPRATELATGRPPQNFPVEADDTSSESATLPGFWRIKPSRDTGSRTPHPLASAEIETNAPYPSFHSDRRVAISFISGQAIPSIVSYAATTPRRGPQSDDTWVFGEEILVSAQSMHKSSHQMAAEGSTVYSEAAVMSRHTPPDEPLMHPFDEDMPEVVSNTKKKKGKKARTQARAFDDESTAGAAVSHTAHIGPYDPDQNLLVGEDPP